MKITIQKGHPNIVAELHDLASRWSVGDHKGVPVPAIRSFHHRDFMATALLERKAGQRISVCIPARDEEATIAPIVKTIRTELMDDVALVDELIVIDDHSTDDTARQARQAGARVVSAADVLPEMELGPGKGQAMWKSLYISEGDIVTWCDADIRQFQVRFILGILGPLLTFDDIGFVKAFYDRPYRGEVSGGGRVTEIMARPLISLLFPHLAPLVQPLSGEYGGRRELLEQVPFVSDYGVELGLLIDLAAQFGIQTIAQVDLGERQHRNRTLDDLGPQAATILHTALQRVDPSLLRQSVSLLRPGHVPLIMDHSELSPIGDLRGVGQDSA